MAVLVGVLVLVVFQSRCATAWCQSAGACENPAAVNKPCPNVAAVLAAVSATPAVSVSEADDCHCLCGDAPVAPLATRLTLELQKLRKAAPRADLGSAWTRVVPLSVWHRRPPDLPPIFAPPDLACLRTVVLRT